MHGTVLAAAITKHNPVSPTSACRLPADEDSLAAGGFDSLAAVELSSSLSTALSVQLPGTLVFDYPSVTSMAQYIMSLMHPSDLTPVEEIATGPADGLLTLPTATRSEHSGSPLFTLQMCMRLPVGYTGSGGDAIARGSDSIRLVPFDRWDLESLRVRECINNAVARF